MTGRPSAAALGVMLLFGLVGMYFSWSSGSTGASIAFGLGALAIGALMVSTVLGARRDREG